MRQSDTEILSEIREWVKAQKMRLVDVEDTSHFSIFDDFGNASFDDIEELSTVQEYFVDNGWM